MRKKIYGDAVGATIGDRQVAQIPVTKAALAPLNVDRFCRNQKVVDASFINRLNESFNAAMLFRTREAFSIAGDLGGDDGGISVVKANSAAGTSNRWRAAFRTSPFHHALLARVCLVPPNAGYDQDGYTRLRIYTGADETGLVAEEEFHYGAAPQGAVESGGWQFHRVIDRFITGLAPDVEHFALISDETYGRVQSMAVADLQSMVENYDGYLSTGYTEQSPILDSVRGNIVAALPTLWRRGGARVFGWSRNYQATALDSTRSTSATPHNLYDSSVTTVSASSPGLTLSMVGKNRLSQTGVPCILKAWGRWEGAGTRGAIYLKDSAGNTIASIVDGWAGGVMAWASTTFDMPLGEDKYDLQISIGGGTPGTAFYCWAVACYEYES